MRLLRSNPGTLLIASDIESEPRFPFLFPEMLAAAKSVMVARYGAPILVQTSQQVLHVLFFVLNDILEGSNYQVILG